VESAYRSCLTRLGACKVSSERRFRQWTRLDDISISVLLIECFVPDRTRSIPVLCVLACTYWLNWHRIAGESIFLVLYKSSSISGTTRWSLVVCLPR